MIKSVSLSKKCDIIELRIIKAMCERSSVV